MSSDNFCLKWNDHHKVFFSSAEQLCHSSLLTDVILSAGGTFFKAHKLVLSVCSKFFQDVFAQPQQVPQANNTVIYLKDVQSTHLQLLLSYMYRGEVDVADSQLSEFLKTASGLQIKGLSEADNQQPPQKARPVSVPPVSKAPPPPQQQVMVSPPLTQTVDSSTRVRRGEVGEGGVPAKRIKEEENEPSSTWSKGAEREEEYSMMTSGEGGADYVEGDYGGYEGEMGGYEAGQAYEQETSLWKTPQPGDQDRLNKAYQCEMCSMSFAQKWLLKRHWKTHTGDKPYKCTICLRTFSLRDSCTRHLRTVHKEMISSSLMGEDVSNFIEVEDGGMMNRPPSHLLTLQDDPSGHLTPPNSVSV